MPPVPCDSRTHIIAACVRENKIINIADIYSNTVFDFAGTKAYDKLNEYRTVSLLCIPMTDDSGAVIGGLQLINALENSVTAAFDKAVEPIIKSLASQAAICLTNINYAAEIKTLLDSFVQAMAEAVDARSPYNANHTKSMVKYSKNFIEWLNNNGKNRTFSEDAEHAFLMSCWLHDVGKLAVPLEVMDKESRLGVLEKDVFHRLDKAEWTNELRFAKGIIGEDLYEQTALEVTRIRSLIEKANKAGYLDDNTFSDIQALETAFWLDKDNVQQPYISKAELEALSVRKGTLTDSERKIIESHVEITGRILSKVEFPKRYGRVYDNAVSHHEFLDGRGYPKRLSSDEISYEARILTILDIYDALTAEDRPYKPPMPPEKAFQILDSMASDNQIDGSILAQFMASGAWKKEV